MRFQVTFNRYVYGIHHAIDWNIWVNPYTKHWYDIQQFVTPVWEGHACGKRVLSASGGL